MDDRWLDPPDNPCEYCIYYDECLDKGVCIKRENYEEQAEFWQRED